MPDIPEPGSCKVVFIGLWVRSIDPEVLIGDKRSLARTLLWDIGHLGDINLQTTATMLLVFVSGDITQSQVCYSTPVKRPKLKIYSRLLETRTKG